MQKYIDLQKKYVLKLSIKQTTHRILCSWCTVHTDYTHRDCTLKLVAKITVLYYKPNGF